MKEVDKMLNTVDHLIEKLAGEKNEFLNDPNSFTRCSKLEFETLVHFILALGGGSIKSEIYRYFGLSDISVSSQAFVMKRQKISFEAFKYLYESFNKKTKSNEYKYKGYRLLAVDGSSIPISYDPNDEFTYCKNQANGSKGYNAFHTISIFDLLEKTYDDLIIQGEGHVDEYQGLCDLVDRYDGDDAIIAADRGYESFNVFVHLLLSKLKFLVRMKDINTIRSLILGLGVKLEGEFDIDISRVLTRDKKLKGKDNYKHIADYTKLDYLDNHESFKFNIRIVRFKISDDTYEVIGTNLNRDEFRVEEIKELYNKRWGIETAFRKLKYNCHTNTFHAKIRDSIRQELYAFLLIFNLAQRIINLIKINKLKKKYDYDINFTQAVFKLKEFLRLKIKGGDPPDIALVIAKDIEPIRPNRSYPRNMKKRYTNNNFNYRII